MESLQGSLLFEGDPLQMQRTKGKICGLAWTNVDTIRKENIKKEKQVSEAGCLFLKWTHWGLIALTKALHAPLWPTVEGDSGGNCQKSSAKVHAPGKSGNVK